MWQEISLQLQDSIWCSEQEGLAGVPGLELGISQSRLSLPLVTEHTLTLVTSRED